jgi:hypothetical protein
MSAERTTPEAQPSRCLRWTPAKRAEFLAALADTGIVSVAARTAGLSTSRAYALKEQDAEFAEAWEDAEQAAVDALELEARRRAHDGVDVPVVRQKGPVLTSDGAPLTIKHYSDRLLAFLLRAKRREQFGDRLPAPGPGAAAPSNPPEDEHDAAETRDRLARRIAGLAARLGKGSGSG